VGTQGTEIREGSKEGEVKVGADVERSLRERFDRAAKANHRSVAGEIRHLMTVRAQEFEAELEEATR
jgi:hypothetical protein